MIRSRLAEASVHAHLGRAFVTIAAAGALLLGGMGVRYGMLLSQYSQGTQSALETRAAIKEAEAAVAKAEAIKPSENTAGMTTATAFQRTLMESALLHKCSVREVTLSADLQPYLSTYLEKTPENGFMQAGFSAVLSGSPQGVTSTLQDLARGSIPFEFNSIQFTRTSVTDTGSVVDCGIELRILTKGAK